MDRREYLAVGGAVLGGWLAGCLGGSDGGTGKGTATPADPCALSGTDDLVAVLPPPPDGFERTVDGESSSSYLDEHDAADAASAEYDDGDEELLDDLTVLAFRFREGADAERILREELNAVEFDSGRLGVAVLDDRVGLVGIAPDRGRARSLLAASPAVPERCPETGGLYPSKTVTPDGG